MKNEVVGMLIGLQSMRETKYITENEYIENISKLCDEYGTEYVASLMMTLGLA